MAMAIVRRRFPGKGIVNALVDLPLALSPVVVGLAFLLLYGTGGWLADLPVRRRVRVSRDGAGDDLHLTAVRRAAVVPVLREIGIEQEQAASTLGASSFQTFRRVTFPRSGGPSGTASS